MRLSEVDFGKIENPRVAPGRGRGRRHPAMVRNRRLPTGPALAQSIDPEDGSFPLTALRVITILGVGTAQVALVCVWRLVTTVRRATVFSDAAFRDVDVVIGAVVSAALVWFAVTAVNAPGQRADPGVTLIMGGIGVAIGSGSRPPTGR